MEGGCYCGALRYRAEGKPVMKGQCHCRECQYISGGGANFFMLMPLEGFSYTKGAPSQFKRSDIEGARTRDFCATCGTHISTRLPDRPLIVIKVGTLDDPAADYGGPRTAIFCGEKQRYHLIEDAVDQYVTRPG